MAIFRLQLFRKLSRHIIYGNIKMRYLCDFNRFLYNKMDSKKHS